MKTEVLIDPWLVSLPSSVSSAEEIDVFVDAVQAWSSAIGHSDVLIVRTDDCLNALYEDGCFPFPDHLKTFMHANNIEHFDVTTITKTVTWLVSRSSLLQDVTGTLEVACYDDHSAIIVPDIFIQRLTPSVADAYQHALQTAAVWRSTHEDSRLIVGSAKHSGDVDGWQEINVSCDVLVDGLSPAGGDSYLELRDHAIPVCCGHDDLMGQQGPWELWSNASSEQCVRDAIQAKIAELVSIGVPGRYRPYHVGSYFVDSLTNRPYATKPEYALPLIETCARIALATPKQRLDAFRTGSEAQAPQLLRERDGAKAFRTHLSKSGPGYRLMLWELPDGSIEFANVGEKHELKIY